MLMHMQERKIVRVNVEVIYDDGTLEELKVVSGPHRPAFVMEQNWGRVMVGAEPGALLCEPR